MRTFRDEDGATWVASVKERPGDDYKGKYWFVMTPEGDGLHEGVELLDVRWNSLKTAERTLRTMSETELRRRHRWAMGRKV
jgi:hypothetical protein